SGGIRSDFGFPLRIGEFTKLGACAARDLSNLVAGLEAGKVRPVLPGERAAELHAGFDRRVVHDVDGALVVRRPLRETRKIAEVAARREYRGDARDLGDLVSVLEPFERLDHQDQDEIVVDGLAVATRDAAPHLRSECSAAAL